MTKEFPKYTFGPVLDLPSGYEVFDLTRGYDPEYMRQFNYGVGRYNEKRPGMYQTDLFKRDLGAVRDIHIGIDLSAPAGTPVRAFDEGRIHLAAINSLSGDYGGTIITEHQLGARPIWALYGHLSCASVRHREVGSRIEKGDILGWLGTPQENGGWHPHLHFQLSWERPQVCDMPGTVNEEDLVEALRVYPDPRLVLGALY